MRWLALPLVISLVACTGHSTKGPKDADRGSNDPVVSSFVFFGGCRLAVADLDPVHNPSSANLPELQQTLADLAALPDPPQFWFFVGDLINGFGPSTTLTAQLDGWAQVYSASAASTKLELVPIVGNHEVLSKHTAFGMDIELSNPVANAAWLAWVKAKRFATRAGNGPTNAPPNIDALQDDESSLTYSFDNGGSHYVVLNTDSWTTTPDPSTGSTQIGWIALHWLETDLAAAEANPAIKGIYLFGHKPLVSPSGSTDSAHAINPALAPTMAQLIDKTPKVRGYFTSHVHEWWPSQLPGRGTYQIIAGNGGSPMEPAWTEPSPYFGFTLVRTYASGKVGVISYRRPAPAKYDAPTTTPAVPATELVIYHP
jgi:hypothetical protein